MDQEATSRTGNTMLRHGKLIIAAAACCVLTLGTTAASAVTGSHPPPRPSRGATPARAYTFWEGTNGDLYEAQGPAAGNLTGPTDLGMGPLGTAPTAGVASNGNTYVYWRGKGTTKDLYEGYRNGSKWAGPYNRDQGPLGSRPAVTIHG